MASIAPPQQVERPTSPAARRYNIMDAANGPLALPRLADVWYQVPWCNAATAYDVDCDSPPGLEPGPGPTTVNGTAFTVDADLSCEMPGSGGYNRMAAMARDKLTATEHVAVEEHVADYLAAAASSDPGNNLGAVLDIVQAVSVLENYAYATQRYGLRAVLHVPVALSAFGPDRMQWAKLTNSGWGTPLGTVVYFNAGLADNEVYITGQLSLWNSGTPEVTTELQAGDRAANKWNMHAWRDWAAAWECFNAYVTVEVA